MGLCRLPRTGCERVGERWRDGAGSLLILGYPATPMYAHMLARAVDAADFRPSRNGDGTVPAGAHSLRACQGAMAVRRGQFADLRYPATPTLAHMLTRAVDGTAFQPSRNGDGAVPAGAHSLRACQGAMARRRGQFADLRYPVTPMLASMFSWAVDGTAFRPWRNGDGAVPAGAHSLRESWRAMARRRGQFADLRYPVIPTLCTHVGAGGRWDRFSTIEKR